MADPPSPRSFRNAAALRRWLAGHHASERELWLRCWKVGSGQPIRAFSRP